MRSLRNDIDIVILKPDKRNGVAIMDGSDHIAKMNNMDGDKTKFKRMNDDWTRITTSRENHWKKYLRYLKKDGMKFFQPALDLDYFMGMPNSEV